MKWQKEQKEFYRRKREHDLQLVEIEKQEIQRREQKMKQKKEDLEEKRQKHLVLQDNLTIQVITQNWWLYIISKCICSKVYIVID